MAKLKTSSGLIKIDLEDIEVKDNSRKDFNNIEELAASIELSGQIQPVVVEKKEGGGYILTAGERRLKAHQLLVKQGKPFNQIEAVVKSGERSIIQLVENINRENLSPKETEAAVKDLLESGLSQADISRKTGKRIQWVSDILAAGKARSEAEKSGVDTSGMSSSALAQLRGLPSEAIQEAKENGGSVAEATRVKKKHKESDPWPLSVGDAIYDAEGKQVGEIIGHKKVGWLV